MTNLEIVINEALAKEIFTEEQVEGYISEGDIPLKTFKEWQKAGFMVKRGQKARLETRLWKLCPGKKEEENVESSERFILVPAYLFTKDQVFKIQK